MSPARWLSLALLLLAACAPAPTAAPSATMAAATTAAPTSPAPATATSAPETATAAPTAEPSATAPPTASPASTATPTPALTGTLTSAQALSITQLAVIETGPVEAVAWAPEGAPGGVQLAAAGQAGVLVFALDPVSQTHTLDLGAWATSVAFDPSGEVLAAGSVSAVVWLWHLPTSEPRVLLTGPGVRVDRLAYAPGSQGRYLASLGTDNTAHVWDVVVQRYLGPLASGPAGARVLAFDPAGGRLATVTHRAVLVWALDAVFAAGGEAPWPSAPAQRLASRANLTALAFAPRPTAGGAALATANSSGTIQLWDGVSDTALAEWQRLAAPAQQLAFSPDGSLLVSAHGDNALRLWDTATGELRHTLAGHTGLITGLAFSPDGRRLATSSRDGTVRLWGVP